MIVPVLIDAGIRATPGVVTAAPGVALAAVGLGEVAIVAIVFTTAGGIIIPLIRAWTRRIGDSGQGSLPTRELAARLERIEHAVDAIAVEVERISEGQRFVTQLMARPDTRHIGPGER